RRRALARFAFNYRLQFSPTDPFGLIDRTFDLFNRGDRARCENVVWGPWQGVQVRTGELWFNAKQQDDLLMPLQASTGASLFQRRSDPVSFAFVQMQAFTPHLSI